MRKRTIFLKLGGSLITDKTETETARPRILGRLAAEIRVAIDENSDLQLVLGHGSGSFGHVAAARHGTRHGVHGRQQWLGFSEVSSAAARLNQLVVEAMHGAGVPIMSVRPSAIVQCEDGTITHIAPHAIKNALAAGLVPLVMGDVAFDQMRGGTIVSTEEVMTALAHHIRPDTLILAGETDGVYDSDGRVIPTLTLANLPRYRTALGGSRGTDVTGGMLSKVNSMLALSQALDSLPIRIISGLNEGVLTAVLATDTPLIGTLLTANT